MWHIGGAVVTYLDVNVFLRGRLEEGNAPVFSSFPPDGGLHLAFSLQITLVAYKNHGDLGGGGKGRKRAKRRFDGVTRVSGG